MKLLLISGARPRSWLPQLSCAPPNPTSGSFCDLTHLPPIIPCALSSSPTGSLWFSVLRQASRPAASLRPHAGSCPYLGVPPLRHLPAPLRHEAGTSSGSLTGRWESGLANNRQEGGRLGCNRDLRREACCAVRITRCLLVFWTNPAPRRVFLYLWHPTPSLGHGGCSVNICWCSNPPLQA